MSARVVMHATTRWMRNSDVRPDDGKPCIERRCRENGDGTHLFCYTADSDPAEVEGRVDHDRDIVSRLHDAVRAMPEGVRIRITVETAEPQVEAAEPILPEPDGVIVLGGQAWRGYTSETVGRLLAEATERTREQVEAEVVVWLRGDDAFDLAEPDALADAITRGEHRTPGGAG